MWPLIRTALILFEASRQYNCSWTGTRASSWAVISSNKDIVQIEGLPALLLMHSCFKNGSSENEKKLGIALRSMFTLFGVRNISSAIVVVSLLLCYHTVECTKQSLYIVCCNGINTLRTNSHISGRQAFLRFWNISLTCSVPGGHSEHDPPMDDTRSLGHFLHFPSLSSLPAGQRKHFEFPSGRRPQTVFGRQGLHDGPEKPFLQTHRRNSKENSLFGSTSLQGLQFSSKPPVENVFLGHGKQALNRGTYLSAMLQVSHSVSPSRLKKGGLQVFALQHVTEWQKRSFSPLTRTCPFWQTRSLSTHIDLSSSR